MATENTENYDPKFFIYPTTLEAKAASLERIAPMLKGKVEALDICNVPIDPEKLNRTARPMYGEVPEGAACVPTGRVYISSNEFVIFREIAKMIARGTEWNKKARIVLEYDPQMEKMTIATFMEPGEADAPECQESSLD